MASVAILSKIRIKKLCKAAKKGDLITIREMMSDETKIGRDDFYYIYGCASINGHKHVLEYTLDYQQSKSNDPNNDHNEHKTIIDFAAEGGQNDIIEWIVSLGYKKPDINTISLAARCGEKETVEYLLSLGYFNKGDINFALLNACQFGHLPIIELLLENGADDLDGPIYSALFGGYRNVIEFLISKGAKVERWIYRDIKDKESDIAKYLKEHLKPE